MQIYPMKKKKKKMKNKRNKIKALYNNIIYDYMIFIIYIII